jgi:DnaJ-domain-containing protein 1
MMAAMGRPEDLERGAREKAAALLGVRPDAPPSVILAACEAQLAEYSPARMAGLPADMQRQARERREALVRAKDLLLKTPGG